jgi:hypothetical protein
LTKFGDLIIFGAQISASLCKISQIS